MPKFQRGQSGNPRGRPRGSADRRTALRREIEKHGTELVERAVQLALGGDIGAMRLCLERIAPPVREEPVWFALPVIERAEDCASAQAAVLAALAGGALLPSEAETLAKQIEALRKAYEISDLAQRLERIEAALERRGKIP